jgi:hypothetical protein
MFQPGCRICFTAVVDLWPWVVVREGETGTVVDADEGEVSVALDASHDSLRDGQTLCLPEGVAAAVSRIVPAQV